MKKQRTAVAVLAQEPSALISYRPKPGAWVSKKDVAEFAPYLEELSSKVADTTGLTPKVIVEDARAVSSPLHRFFEWDTTEAAYQYNLHQARILAASYQVQIVYTDREEPTSFWVRGLLNVRQLTSQTDQEEDDDDIRPAAAERLYIPVKTLQDEPAMLAQVIAEAKRDAQRWKERYATLERLSTFSRLFTTINELISDIPVLPEPY